jgi:hypothetical protein
VSLNGIRRGSLDHVPHRLNYANVMATVAVFIALGGTGYAISKLPKDSVKAKQIAKGAVKSPEVKNGSLRSGDFADGVVTAGPAGPAGPPGPTFGDTQNGGVIGSSSNPVANPEFSFLQTDITTPAAGKLFVMYSGYESSSGDSGLEIDCSSGLPTVGIYVNGTPVPGTKIHLPDNAPVEVTEFGVTNAAVPAGANELALGADCATGNFSSAGISENGSFGAILLGD